MRSEHEIAGISNAMLDRALDALIEFRGEGDELLVREILRAALGDKAAAWVPPAEQHTIKNDDGKAFRA